MGDGTEKSPYTRKDVLRLIEENGGKAEGLDLSNKWFQTDINLSKLKLSRIVLNGATLVGAHLEESDLELSNFVGADLDTAHLEKAELTGADLKNASLNYAHLEQAVLMDTNLKGAYLWGIKLSSDTELEDAQWCDYILGEEETRQFDIAVSAYRCLKTWYTEHGIYDVAGAFFYREMEAKRKAQRWKKLPHVKLWSWAMRLLCGYGEKPERVVISAASVILVATFIYFLVGSVWQWGSFWSSLYFSAVSFTALGYGSWVNTSSDWIRGLGAAESFMGVFMMALFLVTFIRKMTR